MTLMAHLDTTYSGDVYPHITRIRKSHVWQRHLPSRLFCHVATLPSASTNTRNHVFADTMGEVRF